MERIALVHAEERVGVGPGWWAEEVTDAAEFQTDHEGRVDRVCGWIGGGELGRIKVSWWKGGVLIPVFLIVLLWGALGILHTVGKCIMGHWGGDFLSQSGRRWLGNGNPGKFMLGQVSLGEQPMEGQCKT